MVSEQQKVILIIVAVALVALAALHITHIITIPGLPSMSLLGYSPNVVVNVSGNLVRYQVVALTIDQSQGGTFTANLNPPAYQLSNGSTLYPGENVSVYFQPQTPKCNYTLTAQNEPVIFGYNLNLWKYYTMSTPAFSVPIWVKSSKASDSSIHIIDGAAIGQTYSYQNTEPGGQGAITVQVQGTLGGSTSCASPSGNVVLNNNGQPYIVDSATYQTYKNGKLSDAAIVCGGICTLYGVQTNACFQCLNNTLAAVSTGSGMPYSSQFTGFSNLYFADPAGTSQKTLLTGEKSLNSIANPVVTLSADSAWFDSFIYSPPQIATPVILTNSIGDFTMGQPSTFAVIVQNSPSSNANATFTYQVSSNLGSVNPVYGSTGVLKPGDQQQLFFNYAPPSVSANQPYQITVQLCSANQFGGNCTTKTYGGNILYVAPPIVPGLPPTPPPTHVCGDNICQAQYGENSVSCPSDCPNTPPVPTNCGSIPNSNLQGGQCVCNAGFQRTFDQTNGQMQCVPPADWTQYIPWVVGGIVVIVIAYLVVSKRRK